VIRNKLVVQPLRSSSRACKRTKEPNFGDKAISTEESRRCLTPTDGLVSIGDYFSQRSDDDGSSSWLWTIQTMFQVTVAWRQ